MERGVTTVYNGLGVLTSGDRKIYQLNVSCTEGSNE